MKGQRELFHSNVIAWFFDEPDLRPVFVETLSRLLRSKGVPEGQISLFNESDCVFRENNHMDLVFKKENAEPPKRKRKSSSPKKTYIKTLVLENKIKDLATYDQLDKYSEKLKNDDERGRDCAKVVLSFEDRSDSEHPDWTFVYYNDFATLFYELLKKKKSDSDGKVFFARRYARLLNSLATVIEYGDSNDLKEIDSEFQRDIYSLLAKRRYSRYYRKLTNKLRETNFAQKIGYGRIPDKESSKTMFYVNMQYATFTGGMLEAVIDLTDNLRFIIQLQDKGEAIGFVVKNAEIRTKRGKEKTEQQRQLFYDTIAKVKNDYEELVEKLFENRKDFDCKGNPKESQKIHGYNRMVYYLEDKVKIADKPDKSDDAIDTLIREIETVLRIVNPETL